MEIGDQEMFSRQLNYKTIYRRTENLLSSKTKYKTIYRQKDISLVKLDTKQYTDKISFLQNKIFFLRLPHDLKHPREAIPVRFFLIDNQWLLLDVVQAT